MQLLLTDILVDGGKCFVIDCGQSFEHLCSFFGGQSVILDSKTRINLDPFFLINNRAFSNDATTTIYQILFAMGKSGKVDDP